MNRGEEDINLLLIESLQRKNSELTKKVRELTEQVRKMHEQKPHTFPGPTTPIIEG